MLGIELGIDQVSLGYIGYWAQQSRSYRLRIVNPLQELGIGKHFQFTFFKSWTGGGGWLSDKQAHYRKSPVQLWQRCSIFIVCTSICNAPFSLLHSQRALPPPFPQTLKKIKNKEVGYSLYRLQGVLTLQSLCLSQNCNPPPPPLFKIYFEIGLFEEILIFLLCLLHLHIIILV